MLEHILTTGTQQYAVFINTLALQSECSTLLMLKPTILLDAERFQFSAT